MSDADERVPKCNGVSSNPLQRLASFKTPRDLSLGGIKPNKKVFLPNLNVTRNKTKGITSNSRDIRNDDKYKRDRKNDKNKIFKNVPSNIITSGGVFADGVAGARRRGHSRPSINKEAESASTLHRPVMRVKDVLQADRELEERQIRSAVGGGAFNDDEAEDFKNVFTKYTPISLPMNDTGWFVAKAKAKAAAAARARKQLLLQESTYSDFSKLLLKPKVEVKEETYDHSDVVELLRNKQSPLILVQFPDTLPGRGGTEDETPQRKTGLEAATTTFEDLVEKEVQKCSLSQLEEGRVGMLRIHRSGRVTFVFSDTEFEVNMGTTTAFRQEVVTVGVDDDTRSANVVGLGQLLHKLVIVPEWDQMFADMI